jgi:hypothetical protein
MFPNKRDLRAYVRYDGRGRIIPGSLILRRSKPKVGHWKEVPAYLCCGPNPSPFDVVPAADVIEPTTSTSTTNAPTTSSTTTAAPSTTTNYNNTLILKTMAIFPKEMTDSNLTLDNIKAKFNYFELQIHELHWQTKSFAEHEALGDLYNIVFTAKDEFVEKIMGYTGIRTKAMPVRSYTKLHSRIY